MDPTNLPGCFTKWSNVITAYSNCRLTMDTENIPVTVTYKNMTLSISFYPVIHEHPVLFCIGNDN
jgi:hypothetical protein